MATATSASLDLGGEQCKSNPRLLSLAHYKMSPRQFRIKLSSKCLDELDGGGECLVDDDEFTPSIVDDYMEFVRDSHAGPLICLDSDTALYICNPSTKEFVRLPDSRNQSGSNSYSCPAAFGYFPSRDEYKIARLIKQDGTDYRTCEIYTLGRRGRDGVADLALNCWKTIGDRCGYPVRNGVVANGSFHWLVELAELQVTVWPKKLLIITLDVETEMFATLPPPQDDELFDYLDVLQLAAVEGSLCLTEHLIRRPSIFNIWILEDLDMNPTWVKQYSIDIFGLDTEHYVLPLYMGDGELVLYYENDKQRLIFYDVGSQSIERIQQIKIDGDGSSLCVYTGESDSTDPFLLLQ